MASHRRRGLRRSRRGSRVVLFLLAASGAAAVVLAISLMLVVATGAGAALAATLAGTFLSDLPAVDDIAAAGDELFQTTTIYDRRGRPLGELLGLGRRRLVPPDEIPQVVKLAVIASEDATFYENPGVEPRAILRAIWQNFRGGRVVSGASTITQQLVKNVLLTPDETLERKLKEAVLAWQISQRFSKDEILGLYLNQNFYGGLTYGVAAAADTYFGKDVRDLDLAEAAMLAGILPSPSADNPHVDPAAARRVQLRVLDLIERRGFASPERVEAARRRDLTIVPPRAIQVAAPHFFNYVVAQLQTRYGPEISRLGWQITTTLDLDLQRLAERSAREQVAALAERDASNAALLALRPQTGEVLAMLGSVDFNDPEIDGQVNVVLAERQPGSAFKLFTYTTALLKGYTPSTLLLDIPTAVPIAGQETYQPRNYDRKFRGPVSLRTALASSLNVPAVRTQLFAGVDATVELSHRLGITTLQDRTRIGPAVALGSNEVRLLDLTAAYGVVANGGRRVVPTAILCIRDAQGRIVEQLGDGCSRRLAEDPHAIPRVLGERVLSEGVAYLITSILSDPDARVPGFGETGAVLELDGRPAAVKTGTTEDTRDALTVGYTPQLVVGVWVGNSDGHPMDDVTGVKGAAPIWRRFVLAALDGRPVLTWTRPPGVVEREVDALSGFLPSAFTPRTRTEVFLAGTAPTQRDMLHQPFRVHLPTGLLAAPSSPPDEVAERVFVILPKAADAWQRRQPADSPLALPPEEFAVAATPAQGLSDRAALSFPAERQPVRSILEVRGSAAGPRFERFEVHYGAGASPTEWIRIGSPSTTPVQGDKLAVMDTIQLNDALYTLRLAVRSAAGVEDLVFRRFIVDNQPPEARVVGVANGDVIPAGPLPLQIDVGDAGDVAEVEYLIDGRSVGRSRRAPFALGWQAEPGAHRLVARVTDRAGNQAETPPVGFRVR